METLFSAEGANMAQQQELNVMKNSSCSSSSPSEDSNSCPICLGPVIDKCFHKFCYKCILQWTKVVASKQSCPSPSVKCPLCKTEIFSIIHGYDGCSFQKHYLNQDSGDSFILSSSHKYRLQCYYTEPGFLNDIFDVSRYWKSCKYLQPNCWLKSWLRREIQALMQEENVDVIMHHILGLIKSLMRHEQRGQTITSEAKQREFQDTISDAARPFLAARTDRFVNEVELFLASGLNIEAYDAVCMQRLGCRAHEGQTNLTGAQNPYPFCCKEIHLNPQERERLILWLYKALGAPRPQTVRDASNFNSCQRLTYIVPVCCL